MPDADALLDRARALARRYRYPVPGYDKDDLVQEAFLAMVTAPLGSTDEQRYARARNRLSRIAKRAARRRTQELPLQLEGSDGDDPAGRELADIVHKVLPRREAQVVVALFWHDLSVTDLAQRMGVSRVTVFTIRRRALRRLRPYLDVDGGAGGQEEEKPQQPLTRPVRSTEPQIAGTGGCESCANRVSA
jgi:RNA polymerase sigma factor (sigma-70 family)